MGWLASLFGGQAVDAITAIGGVIDEVTTSDEEKAQAEIVMQRLRQEPGKLQAAINKIEASHRSIFVAGWRPFIGWVCGTGLLFVFLVNPLLMWFTGSPGPVLPLDAMTELVLAMLGLGGLRTVEKIKGRTK